MSEHWIKQFWRPAMAVTYMAINIFDFILAPGLSLIIPLISSATYVPWISLTLTNGGFIHMSFAAILGVAAWTRGVEKIQREKNGSSTSGS